MKFLEEYSSQIKDFYILLKISFKSIIHKSIVHKILKNYSPVLILDLDFT